MKFEPNKSAEKIFSVSSDYDENFFNYIISFGRNERYFAGAVMVLLISVIIALGPFFISSSAKFRDIVFSSSIAFILVFFFVVIEFIQWNRVYFLQDNKIILCYKFFGNYYELAQKNLVDLNSIYKDIKGACYILVFLNSRLKVHISYSSNDDRKEMLNKSLNLKKLDIIDIK